MHLVSSRGDGLVNGGRGSREWGVPEWRRNRCGESGGSPTESALRWRKSKTPEIGCQYIAQGQTPVKAYGGFRSASASPSLQVLTKRTWCGKRFRSALRALSPPRWGLYGLYADRNTVAGTGEFMPTPDTAIMPGVITREATERVARVAFDLAGEVSGSPGSALSINTSATTAMARASHGSAPDIAGQIIASPVAMILSGAMLFSWLAAQHGEEKLDTVAKIIERAGRHDRRRHRHPRPRRDRVPGRPERARQDERPSPQQSARSTIGGG